MYAAVPASQDAFPNIVPEVANEMLLAAVVESPVVEKAATQAARLNMAPVVLADPVARAEGITPRTPALPTKPTKSVLRPQQEPLS